MAAGPLDGGPVAPERMVDQPGPNNAITDVVGLRVGHHTAVGDGFLTGTTVILAPAGGMAAGVDVRGGGPATHETDLLEHTASVERIHAIVLTGGSAFGLATCTSVMNELADRGIGLPVGPNPGDVVPLVPGAALFDLGRGGSFRNRPVPEFGALALTDALAPANDGLVEQGSVGAGTGAVSSNLKGGIGTASLVLTGGITVAALVAVNAAGSPVDRRTGELLGASLLLPADGPTPPVPSGAAREAMLEVTSRRPVVRPFTTKTGRSAEDAADSADSEAIRNTTLVVVATDAALTKAQCTKMAAVAQNGLARAINPVHTMFDGDTVFGLSTGTAGPPEPIDFHQLTVAAADVVTRSIVRALLAAQTTVTLAGRWPSWSDVASSGAGRPQG